MNVHDRIKVIIVEDEPLIAENLAMYLNNIDFEVVAMAYDFEEALKALESTSPDIALLDINLESDRDGVDLAHLIKKKYQIPFIFLSSYSDKPTIDRVKDTAPSGYLVKPFNESSLLTTLEISISNFHRQRNEHVPELELLKVNAPLLGKLSEREFEVMQLIYAGNTNQQIAAALYISMNTLKRHINNAYSKLGVTSRTTALARLRALMMK
jgi:DNA-binding NarL/FixJ family response regulator